MMRSPVKKLNLKNDPIEKIRELEEEKEAIRYHKELRARMAAEKSKTKLPKLRSHPGVAKENAVYTSPAKKMNHF